MIHFFSYDPRFCGDTTPGRQVASDRNDVTCPKCRASQKPCFEHETHATMLGHVADYCPECDQPFNPDPTDPSIASW